MLTVIKSAAISLVVVMTTITAEAKKSDFPSFNKSDDFRKLVETALFSDNTTKEVKLSGKKYLVTVSQDIVRLLVKDLFLEGIIEKLSLGSINEFTFKQVLPIFDFYKEELSHKNKKFRLKHLIRLVQKLATPTSDISNDTVSELRDIIVTLDKAAFDLFTLSPEALKDSKNLADFENKGLITKTTLSADGLTQTYKFDAGDTANNVSLEFTVKKV